MQAHALAPIRVLFVLQPDSLVLDWAGPAEALRLANQCLKAQGLAERFVMQFVGTQAVAPTSVGCAVSGLQPLPTPLLASAATPTWVVLVGQPGQVIDINNAPTQTLLHWLRGLRLQAQQLELVTVCAGAVLAANAGIAPLQYLRRIRLAVAQTALQSGRNVTQAAALAGFGSDTQLRRAWHQLGESGTPSNPTST